MQGAATIVTTTGYQGEGKLERQGTVMVMVICQPCGHVRIPSDWEEHLPGSPLAHTDIDLAL